MEELFKLKVEVEKFGFLMVLIKDVGLMEILFGIVMVFVIGFGLEEVVDKVIGYLKFL